MNNYKCLNDKSFMVDAISNYQTIPLDELIIRVKQLDLTKEYKCSPESVSKGFHPIHFFVLMTNKRPDVLQHIKNIIEEDRSLLTKTNDKLWRPLTLAARNSNTCSSLETVKLLLDLGSDVNFKPEKCLTALMFAARHVPKDSTVETIKLLISYGADVNILDDDGQNALMLAITYDLFNPNIDTVNLLIESGIDLNVRDKHGRTALDILSNSYWPLHHMGIEKTKFMITNTTLSRITINNFQNLTNRDELIDFIINTKQVSDSLLTQMIRPYRFNDPMFAKILAKSSYQKNKYRYVDVESLIKTSNRIKLHYNSLMVKMLSLQNTPMVTSRVDNATIRKMKDFFGLPDNIDNITLIAKIEEYRYGL